MADTVRAKQDPGDTAASDAERSEFQRHLDEQNAQIETIRKAAESAVEDAKRAKQACEQAVKWSARAKRRAPRSRPDLLGLAANLLLAIIAALALFTARSQLNNMNVTSRATFTQKVNDEISTKFSALLTNPKLAGTFGTEFDAARVDMELGNLAIDLFNTYAMYASLVSSSRDESNGWVRWIRAALIDDGTIAVISDTDWDSITKALCIPLQRAELSNFLTYIEKSAAGHDSQSDNAAIKILRDCR
jgi:hypothetical protein